jgi:tetraacyldisaccharide 4'-kinase
MVVAADGGLVAHDLHLLPRRAVVGIAGVGRPERFWRLLDRLGVQVAERIELPDHHAYAAEDLARPTCRQRAARRSVVTTEKDLVKLARLPDAAALRLHAVRIEVAIEDGDRLVDTLLA